MRVLMHWFLNNDPAAARFPAFMRAFGLCKQEGEVYLPAALAGDEAQLQHRALQAGVGFAEHRDHVYLPAEWLIANGPSSADVLRRLVSMAIAARPDAKQCVIRYMKLVEEMGLDDRAISLQLDEECFARTLIHRVVHLTPIALGRRVLRHHGIQFSPEFRVMDPDGSILHEGLLADEPAYQAAYTLEPALLAQGAVHPLVKRSPEVLLFEKAVAGGADPKDLESAPVVIFSDPSSAAGQRAAQKAAESWVKGRHP